MRLLIAILLYTIALYGNVVNAKIKNAAEIPNGMEFPNLIYTDAQNKELTSFGKDFVFQRNHWTNDLCMKDSDGDGVSNGVELGDPCCTWKETGNVAYILGISDPNNPSSIINPLIYEEITCTVLGEANAEEERKKSGKASRKKKKTRVVEPEPDTLEEEQTTSKRPQNVRKQENNVSSNLLVSVLSNLGLCIILSLVML